VEANEMKIGYFTLSDNNYGDARTPNDLLRHIMEEAIFADELGFASAWIGEHHFNLFGTCPSPQLFLANLAARTSRVRLAPAVTLLPCRHPLQVAEEFALLDVLSDGRVDFAAGRGYDRREYEAFGVPFEQSAELFREGLDIVRRAWSEDPLSYQGQFYRIPEVSVSPRPVQRPYPPIYVACFSKPTMEMAAESGFHIIFAPFAAAMMFGSIQEAARQFKAMAAAHGHPDSQVMCSYFMHVCHNQREVQAAKETLIRYFHSILPALPSDPATTPRHIAYFVDIVKRLQAMRPEDLTSKSMIFGEPDYCIDHLRQLAGAGIREVILYFNFGCQEHQAVMDNMKFFAREVLPYIAERPPVSASR
jgi:alkanesulfonate monooxygenase SsuD/methylene tetrahydromethanopterin reductase-like flavin-dependent oxidoreductase (luciferase family)